MSSSEFARTQKAVRVVPRSMDEEPWITKSSSPLCQLLIPQKWGLSEFTSLNSDDEAPDDEGEVAHHSGLQYKHRKNVYLKGATTHFLNFSLWIQLLEHLKFLAALHQANHKL
mmetsp:Transcript_28192/g.52900  ORF Transcript_28192/g.52900 Transcript_28192/m.52900 type:complete len:113 (+) Transcript_28192:239-577(+)